MVRAQTTTVLARLIWALFFLLYPIGQIQAAILPPPTCSIFDEPYFSVCRDQVDPPTCEECECPPGSGGGGCGMCFRPQGMPVWSVSEPLINLRLEDEPLGYKPARGKRVDFHLSYRQRGNPALDPAIFGVGPNWTTSFRAFVVDLSPYQFDGSSRICLQRNGAGWVEYVDNVQSRNQSFATNLPGGGYVIEYSNGAKDLFQQPYAIEQGGFPYLLYFLSATVDTEGNTNTYRYANVPNAMRLQSITDADGNSTTLFYENTNFQCQITRVVDPFQRTSRLFYDNAGFLTNIVDVAGMGTSFKYAELSAIGSGWITNMSTPYGNTFFRYDGENLDEESPFSTENNAVNRLIEITEPNGTHQLYVYRQNCSILNDTNATAFLPASYANIPVTSPLFNTFDNEDQFSQTTQSYNALNEITVSQYDNTTHLLTNVLRPSGLVTSYAYDPATYRLRQSVDEPIHRTNSYTYYTNGLIFSQTDPRGLTTTNHWDNLQRLTSVDYPDGTTVSNIFDKLDLVAVKDRKGGWTRFGFNAVRQKTFETNANNVVTAYGYCDCGALMEVTNALGTAEQEVTSFGYDNQGNRCYVFLPDGTTITNWFDAPGCLYITADGSTTRFFQYNNQGLITQVSNALGVERHTLYDIEDHPIELTDANGLTVTNTYDVLGRIRTHSYPGGGVEEFGYTANISGQTSYTNPITEVVLFNYDEGGRKTREIKPGLATNTFSYSVADDLLSLTNAANQFTSWRYDSYGHVTNQVETTGIETLRYSYDSKGQLTNRWSIEKGNTSYSYDPVGNLTVIQYPQSVVTNIYDANNRLKTMTDDTGTTSFSYYPGGRILSEDGPWDHDTITYNYANRLRASMSVDSPIQTLLFSYGYDSARRLTNVSAPSGNFAYHYSSEHVSPLASRIDLPNGAAITNAYDGLSRILSTTLINSQQTVLNSHSYLYNPANQRTNQARLIAMGGHNSSYTIASNSVAYGYDSLGQLTSALGREGSSIRRLEHFGYGYDLAGNLRNRTNDALVQQFFSDGLNELTNTHRSGTLTVSGTTTSFATNVTVNNLSATLYGDGTFVKDGFSIAEGDNSFTAIAQDDYGRRSTNTVLINCPTDNNFRYDSNGNLTNDGNRVFEYDAENQLIRVTIPQQSKSEFVYDGKKRRKVRKEFVAQGGAWTQTDEIHYLYDGNVVVQERWYTSYQPLADNPKRTVTYTRGKDLKGSFDAAGGIGGLLAFSQLTTNSSQWVNSYYHDDGNGNITCLLNARQQVVGRYLYDPYGGILSQSGALADANLYRFSSKEFHPQSGLIYYLYRFYDPSLQSWINKDPKGVSELIKKGPILPSAAAATAANNAGPGLSIENLYNFVENDPLNRVDALGLYSFVKVPNVPFFFACPTLTGHIFSCSMKVTICVCPPKPQLIPCVGHAIEVMLAGCEMADFNTFSMGCGTAKMCFDFIQ